MSGRQRSRPWRKIRKRLWIIPAAALLCCAWPLAAAAPLTVGAVLGVVLALIASGANRQPCGPAFGQNANQHAARQPTGSFRLATFNIHGGKGADNARQLDRVAASLAGVDLAALQEVRGAWLGQGVDQATELARMLHLDALFAPSVRQWWHYDFGGGLITRLPIRDWLRIPLPRTSGKSFQNILLARCDLGGGQTLHVLALHVEYRCERQRAEHLAAALALFDALAGPVVLLGDLNLTRQAPRLAALAQRADVHAVSHGTDWIIARGLRIERHGVEDRGASDHACVWADVTLAESLSEAPRQAA